MNGVTIFILLSIYFGCVYNSEGYSDLHKNSALTITEGSQRKTGHYFLYSHHGWHALSWIYWIKVKLIIVAFFVGTAFIWAIQYISKFSRYCPYEHVHYGHYRSLGDPTLVAYLQNLP